MKNRPNSSAVAMELRLFSIDPLISSTAKMIRPNDGTLWYVLCKKGPRMKQGASTSCNTDCR